MKRKYSVFLHNVGSCSDRYCPMYAPPFSYQELFARAAAIDLIRGVDLVATPDFLEKIEVIKASLKTTGLKAVSIAVDLFTQEKWKQGTFSSVDPKIRKQVVNESQKVMDLAVELGCDMILLWPGQDGYDYLFQADYLAERTWFTEGAKEVCAYRKDVKVTLEYKIKEPRTHSYVNNLGTTLLMVQAIGEPNCGVVIDYGHALLGYENPAESVALLKQYGDKLMHIHINDNYRYWDDDMIVGSVHTLEFLEFFYWLRRTGYEGWITIDQYPYREDGKEAVAESAAWLDFFEMMIDNADMAEITETLKKKDAISASRLMRNLLKCATY